MKPQKKNFKECITCVKGSKYVNITLRTFDRLLNSNKLIFVAALGCWVVR